MKYVPIRLSTVKPDVPLSFDVYVFFKEHYLQYIHKGNPIPGEKVDKMKNKNIKKLFIDHTQEDLYQAYLDNLLEEVAKNPSMATQEKVNVVNDASSTAIEKMQEDPGNAKNYKKVAKAAQSLREILTNDPQVLALLFDCRDEENPLVQHALNTSALSIKLAMKKKIKGEQLDFLSIASFLHDVGIPKLPGDYTALFMKREKELTNEEKKIYFNHPHVAAEYLKDKPYCHPEILDLVIKHEEKISGEGYPEGLQKLSPIQEILSLVNAFDKRITCQKMSIKEALNELQVDELGNYPLALIQTFKDVLKEEMLLSI